MIAGFLEQEVVLGPLAAIGDRGSSAHEIVASAIDEPGAGGVHALKSGQIEGHAFCVFSQRKKRGSCRLELTSAADDPFPG